MCSILHTDEGYHKMRSLQRDHAGRFYYCYDYDCFECGKPFATEQEQKGNPICPKCKEYTRKAEHSSELPGLR